MRIKTEDWIDAGLMPTTNIEIVFEGLMNAKGTVIVIPRSDESRMDCMMNQGFSINQTKNETIFTETSLGIGSIKSHDLRLFTNKYPLLKIGNCVLQSTLLSQFNRIYKRKTDELQIFQGENDDALGLTRMISPCKDWWIVFAAYHLDALNDNRIPKSVTLEHFNGGEVNEL